MSLSPNSSIVNRTIDLNYANKKRSSSLKWLIINLIVLLLLVYDLYRWHGCAQQWAQAACACALGANVALYAARALRCGRAAAAPARRAGPAREPTPPPAALSLAVARAWRAADASPPPSPPSPAARASPRPAADEFIADHRCLADYLREQGARAERAGEAWARWGGARSPPPYQLAAPDAPHEGSPLEEPAEGSEQACGGEGALAWRRLALQPALLTRWNQNLRLWLHATILRRLAAELDRVDAALDAQGLGDARPGHAPLERLQKLPEAAALLPYLRPFSDQRYAVARVRELARGGCLSAYRWAGGGAGWDEARPPDAELLLTLLSAYLDAQLGGAGAFSAAHVSRAPAPPPRHAGALAVHRVAARPPHYVLALRDETVEVGRGRNNLLHTLLLLVAAAARAEPPALGRLHLGPAGLNMLWIIGR